LVTLVSVTTAIALRDEVGKPETLNQRDKALIVANLNGFISR
jgi:hypothetical protein